MYKSRSFHAAGTSWWISAMVRREVQWHGKRGAQGRSAFRPMRQPRLGGACPPCGHKQMERTAAGGHWQLLRLALAGSPPPSIQRFRSACIALYSPFCCHGWLQLPGRHLVDSPSTPSAGLTLLLHHHRVPSNTPPRPRVLACPRSSAELAASLPPLAVLLTPRHHLPLHARSFPE